MLNESSPVATAAGLRLAGLWYFCGGAMLLAVAVLSLVPVADVGVGDKLSHVITYFVLAAWFGILAANRARLVLTIALLFAYGAVLELLQGMTGYRFAEWGDLIANGAGILLGAPLHYSPLRRLLRLVDFRLARSLPR